MIDGKIYDVIIGTTCTQRYHVCGLTSKDFNNLDKAFSAYKIGVWIWYINFTWMQFFSTSAESRKLFLEYVSNKIKNSKKEKCIFFVLTSCKNDWKYT